MADVGQPASAGSATFGPAALTVTSTGADVAGVADQFTFVYRPIVGNAEIVAKVDGTQALDAGAQAGVMIRESLSGGARHGFVFASGNRGAAFRIRATADRATTDGTVGSANGAASWLKLRRDASQLIASRSTDGVTWTVVSSSTVPLPEMVFVGLAVASHSAPSWISATFSNVRVTGSGTLDDGFSAVDVGAPALTGGSWSSSGTFLIDGGGHGIGATEDQFRFVYRPFTGDADVMTRVAAFETATADARAGIVVRTSLDAASPFAAVLASQRGVEFATRSADAEPSSVLTGGAVSAPVYLRLRRAGTAVTALRSPDGVYWNIVGQQEMPVEFGFVGLAATGTDPQRSARVRFDNTIVSAAQPGGHEHSVDRRSPQEAASTPMQPVAAGEPNKVIFVASRLHDDVERYVLEIFMEHADPMTARAVAVVNLGRPAVVSGQCSVDIASRILALAPGRYIATVTAIVPAEGTFRSDPSPVFTR